MPTADTYTAREIRLYWRFGGLIGRLLVAVSRLVRRKWYRLSEK